MPYLQLAQVAFEEVERPARRDVGGDVVPAEDHRAAQVAAGVAVDRRVRTAQQIHEQIHEQPGQQGIKNSRQKAAPDGKGGRRVLH